MKFFIDRCAGRRLADWLVGEGHDVRVAWEYMPDPGDAELLRLSAEDERILITIDSDFGTLVFLHGAAHAGIIRLPDVPATPRIELLRRLLERHGEAELTKAVVTVSETRIRFSRPMLSKP